MDDVVDLASPSKLRAVGDDQLNSVAGTLAKLLGAEHQIVEAPGFIGALSLVNLTSLGIRDLQETFVFVTRDLTTASKAYGLMQLAIEMRRSFGTTGFILLIDLSSDSHDLPHERESNGIVRLSPVELSEIQSSEKPAAVLFRCVRSQIPFTLPCPFDTTNVATGGMFTGRTSERRKIASNSTANYIITGGRRVGKSSLLEMCHSDTFIDKRYAGPVILENALTWGTSDDNIARVTKMLAPNLSEYRSWVRGRYSGLAHIADAVTNAVSHRHYLFLDELDRVVDEDEVSDWQFFRFLAALSAAGKVRLVCAGFRSMRKLLRGRDSPFYRKAKPVELQPLSTPESRALVCNPFDLYDVRISDREKFSLSLHAVTGGFPFMLQHFGEELFSLCSVMKTPVVSHRQVGAIATSNKTRKLVLEHLFDNTREGDLPSKPERLACCLLAEAEKLSNTRVSWSPQEFFDAAATHKRKLSAERIHDAIEELCHAGVFSATSARKYRFAFPMIGQELNARYPRTSTMIEALVDGDS